MPSWDPGTTMIDTVNAQFAALFDTSTGTGLAFYNFFLGALKFSALWYFIGIAIAVTIVGLVYRMLFGKGGVGEAGWGLGEAINNHVPAPTPDAPLPIIDAEWSYHGSGDSNPALPGEVGPELKRNGTGVKW